MEPTGYALGAFAEDLVSGILVNRSQLALALAAAVRGALGSADHQSRQAQEATQLGPDWEAMIRAELPRVVESLTLELRPRDAAIVTENLAKMLERTDRDHPGSERWRAVLETLQRERPVEERKWSSESSQDQR